MATTKVPKRLAKLVRERAHHRCEYCQTSEWLSGQRCQIDHIIPRAHGGATEPDNLCLACVACNGYKLDRLDAADPESGETAVLFNPRTQRWYDHFAWSDDGTRIIGLTPCGRATVSALKLNRPLAVAARAVWVSIHRHPPED
jgi:hypothetical protein